MLFEDSITHEVSPHLLIDLICRRLEALWLILHVFIASWVPIALQHFVWMIECLQMAAVALACVQTRELLNSDRTEIIPVPFSVLNLLNIIVLARHIKFLFLRLLCHYPMAMAVLLLWYECLCILFEIHTIAIVMFLLQNLVLHVLLGTRKNLLGHHVTLNVLSTLLLEHFFIVFFAYELLLFICI